MYTVNMADAAEKNRLFPSEKADRAQLFLAETALLADSQPRRAHELPFGSIVGYTLLNTLSFAPHLLPKFAPATAGDIDCNLSLFHLQKDDKKVADIFSITDLKHKY